MICKKNYFISVGRAIRVEGGVFLPVVEENENIDIGNIEIPVPNRHSFGESSLYPISEESENEVTDEEVVSTSSGATAAISEIDVIIHAYDSIVSEEDKEIDGIDKKIEEEKVKVKGNELQQHCAAMERCLIELEKLCEC